MSLAKAVSGAGSASEQYNRSIVREPEPPLSKSHDENEPILYCPVCSTRLSERKCKLLCEQCGYFMSCADYY